MANVDLSEQEQVISENSLQTLKYIFQILVGLSLTRGAIIFFAHGKNALHLPDGTYWLFGWVLFIAFAFTLIKMTHGYSVYLLTTYSKTDGWFAGKRYRPLFDFSILFVQSAVFFTLSATVNPTIDNPTPATQPDFDPATTRSFFIVIVALFAIDVLWSIIGVVLDQPSKKPRQLGKILTYTATHVEHSIAYNGVFLVVTVVVLVLTQLAGIASAYVPWVLLALLIGRNVWDMKEDRHRIFPRAFRM